MNILHVSNGYASSMVHRNLIRAIDERGVQQTVYCPVRENSMLNKNQFEGNHVAFIFSCCIKTWYKYVYHFKLQRLYHDLKKSVDLRTFDIVHASTLFSDGGVAYEAYKKYGIPYIVAVRNTDINIYIRKLKHTYKTGREIALHAERIIFISKGELKEFEESNFAAPIYQIIKDKIIFQPNGIDDFWLDNIIHGGTTGKDILYIGDYSANKNVSRLAEAVVQLRKEKGFENVCLLIVGGEKLGNVWKDDEVTHRVIAEHPEFIKALGKIYDREHLKQIMRNSALFAMPSIHETFGLVYLEALSQNLPVIYSQGQGIDGLFDSSVGEKVNPLSVESIKEAIIRILNNPQCYSNKCVNFSLYDWHQIADNYIKIYQSILL